MIFEFMDCKPRNPYLNLAIDEALALFFYEWHQKIGLNGGARLWTNETSIILGRTDAIATNLREKQLANLRIGPGYQKMIGRNFTRSTRPIFLARRLSGGGTVMHSPCSLNYSIFLNTKALPDLYSVKKSFQILLGILQKTLSLQKIKVIPIGQSDLAIPCEDGRVRKVAGNAQFRKRSILVFHGSIILESSLIDLIDQYLLHPAKEPEYRKKRSHREFLMPLPDDFNLSIFYGSLMNQLKELTGDYQSSPLALEELRSIYQAATQWTKKRYLLRKWIVGEDIIL